MTDKRATWPELPANEKEREAFLANREKVEAAINSIDFDKLAAAADKYRPGNSQTHRATYMGVYGFESDPGKGKGDHQTWNNPLLAAYAKHNDMHIPQNMWNIRTSEQPIGYESVDMGGKSGLSGSWGGTVARNEWMHKAIKEQQNNPAPAQSAPAAMTLDAQRRFLLDNGFVPLEQHGGTSQVWTHTAMMELMKQIPDLKLQQPAEHGKHGEAFTVMLSLSPSNNNWDKVAQRVQWCREKCVQMDRVVKMGAHTTEMLEEAALLRMSPSWRKEAATVCEKEGLEAAHKKIPSLRQAFESAQRYRTVLLGAAKSLTKSQTQLINQLVR